jgi:RNA polymerase sigma factor (sigma-70 family)
MDPDIWRNIRDGDADAMRVLYQECFHDLYVYGMRMIPDKQLVQDCLHEVFCEIWLKRNTLSTVVYIRSYLKTCVRHRLLKEIEESKKLAALDEETQEQPGEQSYEFRLIASQEDEERHIRIGSALQQLSKMQRKIIQLKYYDGLSYEQIATQLKLKPRTVYNHIFIALSSLRAALK